MRSRGSVSDRVELDNREGEENQMTKNIFMRKVFSVKLGIPGVEQSFSAAFAPGECFGDNQARFLVLRRVRLMVFNIVKGEVEQLNDFGREKNEIKPFRSIILLNKKYFVTGDFGGNIILWNLDPIRFVHKIEPKQGIVWTLRYVRKDFISSACSTGRIRVHHIEPEKEFEQSYHTDSYNNGDCKGAYKTFDATKIDTLQHYIWGLTISKNPSTPTLLWGVSKSNLGCFDWEKEKTVYIIDTEIVMSMQNVTGLSTMMTKETTTSTGGDEGERIIASHGQFINICTCYPELKVIRTIEIPIESILMQTERSSTLNATPILPLVNRWSNNLFLTTTGGQIFFSPNFDNQNHLNHPHHHHNSDYSERSQNDFKYFPIFKPKFEGKCYTFKFFPEINRRSSRKKRCETFMFAQWCYEFAIFSIRDVSQDEIDEDERERMSWLCEESNDEVCMIEIFRLIFLDGKTIPCVSLVIKNE